MSIGMSLLAILQEGATHGLRLKKEFEARTGTMWPLNVGQVYSTLARLERDGLVEAKADDGEKIYEVTDEGRATLHRWFLEPSAGGAPNRDENDQAGDNPERPGVARAAVRRQGEDPDGEGQRRSDEVPDGACAGRQGIGRRAG